MRFFNLLDKVRGRCENTFVKSNDDNERNRPAMELTSRERFIRTFKHQEIDRIIMLDYPWAGTLKRWHEEGLPENVAWDDYFGFDKRITVGCDITPRFETKILEETDRYVIHTTNWGATLKSFKELDSTPEFLDFFISDPEHWEIAKSRMTPTDDRIDWAWLDKYYDQFRSAGEYMDLGFWFGFDVTHSWASGTENVLIGMYEDPEWIMDMFDHYLNVQLALFDKILAKGYKFDGIHWPDDMGYKNSTFFSLDMYREMLKPFHKKACDWAHERGMFVELHSCGYIEPFIPDLIEIGIDCLNPIEVKAGMDPVRIKKNYGDKLTLRGGINAVLWPDKEAIIAELDRLIPILKENSGYIFASDHSIPNSVSLENFTAISDRIHELGRY